MRILAVLVFALAATASGQPQSPNIEAQSSGKCSPNILSNQGIVQFTCSTALDKTTAAKIVSMLNRILQKESSSGGLTGDVDEKVDQLLNFLKSPPPIERTEKFAVMVPYDTEPNSFPIPIDENPDDPLFRTYLELHSLATNGTVPPNVRAAPGDKPISWQSEPISTADAPAFLGRLLQYYIFSSIDKLERNTVTVAVGYPAEARAGIEPPNAMPYSDEQLFRELANNRFFQPFQNRKSSDHMAWELKPVVMPEGTEIKFVEEARPARYVIRLMRPGYFRIEYAVENFLGTGPGSVPRHFMTPRASTTMQWAFFVTMRYEIQRRAEDNFHPELYVQWADALYAGLQQQLDESKGPK